jgi:hypothetical protein
MLEHSDVAARLPAIRVSRVILAARFPTREPRADLDGNARIDVKLTAGNVSESVQVIATA